MGHYPADAWKRANDEVIETDARFAAFLAPAVASAAGTWEVPFAAAVVFSDPSAGQREAVKLMTLGCLRTAAFVTNDEPS